MPTDDLHDSHGDLEIDFHRLVDHVRTQSSDAAGSDTDRVTIRSLESVDVDALHELRSALEGGEDIDPGALTFFLSPSTAEQVLETSSLEGVDALEETLGRPVHVEAGMPADAILLLDPDAVDGDSGELLEPRAIACGTVGKAT